jgi:glyoxylase-like metal-dependent hydrolase (beta-lactamase superfamily II)
MNPPIITLDLNFQATPGIIASYLIPHDSGLILIESGPGSTLDNLIHQLAIHGYTVQDVTDVLLTHIHLDHAGAAGWLSHAGARIHVHPNGATHLADPSRLIASATRIYGDQMSTLWGEVVPTAPDKISLLQDSQPINLQGINILPLETPGHASHHMVFFFEGICFSGDIGGVRMAQAKAVRAPLVPPDLNFELWRESLERITSQPFTAIAPTHFGIYPDPDWHFQNLRADLDRAENWMEENFSTATPPEELKERLNTWSINLDIVDNLDEKSKHAYELANPSFMAFDGIYRYWKKYRQSLV